MIARSLIFLTALFSILTIVAGLKYNAAKDYFPLAEKSGKKVERYAEHAIRGHALAAGHHARINDPRHQNASEAHGRKRNSFVTRLEGHRRLVKHYSPSNNKDAFDRYVANERLRKKYRKSGDHAHVAAYHMEAAELDPILANAHRDEALSYQPTRLACGVDPLINGR